MPNLYGQDLNRIDLARRAGQLSQFGGVRLMTLGDGLERGIRVLEFRSGTGLRFSVLVDRAFDIADCDFRGMPIGWHSPAGTRNPALHEPEGEGGLGWLRSFSGLMVTCGLDHILFMDSAPADHYNYGPRESVENAIHGRVGAIPAQLVGYGERWTGETCTFWAEGIVRQGTVFGEHLEMRRRIEIDLGSNDIRLHDEVVNRGFYATPHMYCYHINVSHPVLDEGARYIAPISDVVWAAHADSYEAQGVGYHRMSAPNDHFHEQVWQHELAASDEGEQPVALVNDRIGLGFEVTTRKDQFPCMYEWQNFQSGQYALGIEPSTNHVLGAGFARERGEVIMLGHGETRCYDSRFRILTSAGDIAASEARIRAIGSQPDTPYPALSGSHRPLNHNDCSRPNQMNRETT